MKFCLSRIASAVILMVLVSSWSYAQGGGTSSTLTGTVVDQTGGVIPGAEVAIKNNATGAEAKTLTGDNGTFSIPFLSAGSYTATVTMQGFKQAVVKDIVLTAGAPATIRVSLQVGGKDETVTVEANAELVQSSTATITTTMNVTQISSLPLATRSALDFLVFLPGVNTTSTARNATISGLPNNTINITIDGINTQDNYLKGNAGGDGMFSMITPRLDAVQEVTLSTATPGSEAAGQGAVQIKFVTRSGNNEYHGSLYEYYQNTWLNANTWFNNRDKGATYNGTSTPCTATQLANEWDKCKAPRNRTLLNQFGFRLGGPISAPKWLFGKLGFDGKDRAFFFVNYEESRQPFQQSRTRTIFNPLVDQGIFPYTVSGVSYQANLFDLARTYGQTATWDPTIQKLLADIRSVSNTTGSVKQRTDPAFMDYLIVNSGTYIRKSPTLRFDFNLTSKQRIEATWNYYQYVPNPDTTNSADWAYPGFPNYGTQGGNRFSGAVALRSTLTPRIVNEVRFGFLGGTTLWWPDVNVGQFKTTGIGNQDGYALSLRSGGVSNAYTAMSPERRNDPNETIEDNLNWSRSSHSLSFGGTFTNVANWIWDQDVVPTIGFGVDSTYDPAYVMFNPANKAANFPKATDAMVSTAQSIYGLLTGRVTSIGGNGVLSEVNNQYTYNGSSVKRGHMREMGFFASDSWRVKPGLTLNYGLRWELQLPFVPLNGIYTYNTMADVWGLSGAGNMFKPGTMTGQAPTYKQYVAGSPAYNTDYKTVAPSFGFAWSPSFNRGLLGKVLGGSGKSVFRGGFSVAYNRNGMYDYDRIFGNNPGAYINATRDVSNGNLVIGTDTWPLLFRDKSRLGQPAFATAPAYPLTSSSISDYVDAFDPNLRTPYTLSWSFGLQRELTKDMALEVRYVATRNKQPWIRINYNEQNLVENGFLNEFKLAMANLQANIAAGRGNSFAYFGPGSNTSPLPITLAYVGGNVDPNDPVNYTKAVIGTTAANVFTNGSYVNTLARYNANPGTYATNLWNNVTQRANAAAAGIPANFFFVNPTIAAGRDYVETNGGFNKYDSMVVELRRRLSKGLLVQANYTFAKGLDSSWLSFRSPYVTTTGSTVPHAFKVNWVYEVPFGQGRLFFTGANRLVDRIIGGWEFQGTGRIQSGSLLNFGNVRLYGITADQLRDAAGLRFDDAHKQVYYLPDSIIQNTIKAFNTSATSLTGYSASGAPTGAYVAPVNTTDCIQIYSGQCAPLTLYLRGPAFWNFDLSAVKKIRFTEQKNLEMRGEFLNAFNKTNFNGTTCQSNSQSCGQLTGTQGGPRNIQVVLRINF